MRLGDRVREFLSPEGALARRLDTYEQRPEQQALASAIAEALDDGASLVAEAGTGVGKSFAYLLPAILWADAHKTRVVISTRTKALQEQLAQKDLPFLQAVLPIEFTWAVAVGRNNYLCKRRLQRATQSAATLYHDAERAEQIAAIAAWDASHPDQGVRNELSFIPNGRVWDDVQAEQGNCLGARCKFFDSCHWQRGKRVMRSARVLVVNHALYFADLALRRAGARYLPDHECVVFDEAHHLEAIAGESLGGYLSPARIEWQLSRLVSQQGSRGILIRAGLAREAELVHRLRLRAAAYFAAPAAMLDHAQRGQYRLGADETIEDRLSEGLRELGLRLARAAEDADDETGLELANRARQLGELAELVTAFAKAPTTNEVRWIERVRKQAVLRAAPVRVATILGSALFAEMPRAILVSATLGPAERGFEWLRSRLGVRKARTLLVGSPFPYADNVELVLEEGLPDPGNDAGEFERQAGHRIRELCIENDGRALVLFTSWRMLERCRELAEPELARHGIDLLVQGDEPTTRLIDKKREDERSVLFGTDTLWEGIDLPGDAVTLVILTRFPFPVPSHPLIAARCEQLERSGQSGFAGYSVPLAVLKFKQGFGRLVRSAADHGRVVILDPRARRRAYGRRFLEALPKCRDADAL